MFHLESNSSDVTGPKDRPVKLIHHWTFDYIASVSNIKDSVTGRGVRLFGTPRLSSVGEKKLNKFLQLKGRSSLDLGNLQGCASNIDKCKNGFTLGFWLRQRLRRQQVVIIGNIQPGQNTNGFRLMTYQTKFFLRINTKSGSEVCTYQAGLGTWKYHVIIWHGDDVSVYVDNVPAKIDKRFIPGGGGRSETTAPLMIGRPNFRIDADFDDITFWDGAMESEQIEKLLTPSLGKWMDNF